MKRFLLIAVAVVFLVLAAWTLFTLNWSYSEGERAGYVQKLSERGWICKTWEGEMAMVTILLALLPYVLLRGPIARIARHWLAR